MAETLEEALARLGAAPVGFNPLLSLAAYPGNVSASGISSAFSPEVLLASGILSPQALAGLQQSTLDQLMTEYIQRATPNVPVPYEASDQFVLTSPVVSKYSGTDDLSDYMTTQFGAIARGEITPAQAKQFLAEQSMNPDYKVVLDNFAQVSADLDEFGKLADRNREAKAKYQYDVSAAQSEALAQAGPAPTGTTAMMELGKQLGIPGLSLLPEPTSTYQFAPEQFVDPTRMSALQSQLEALRTQAGQTRPGGIVTETGSQAMDVRRQMLRDVLATAGATGERVKAERLAATPKPDMVTKILDYVSGRIRTPLVGTQLLGETSTQRAQERATEAGKVAGGKVLADYLFGKKPQVTAISELPLSDPYKRAAILSAAREKEIATAQNRAAEVARLVSEGLAARGITPYQDAINQLISYSVDTARK